MIEKISLANREKHLVREGGTSNNIRNGTQSH